MGVKTYLNGSIINDDLQNAILNQSAQMQQNMYGQLQNILGQGLLGQGLGSIGNQLATPDEIRYIPGIELMKKSLGAPTRVLKLRNEEWLDSKIMQYRGNLQ